MPGFAGNPFARDERGRTVLFHAARRGSLPEVEKIIFSLTGVGFAPQRLALIEVKDHDGMTAADVAEEHGHGDVAALLRGEQGRMEMFE